MRKIGLIIVILLFAQAAFAAENRGFYVGVTGGYVIPDSMTISDPDTGNDIWTDVPLKNGGLVGVITGWNTPFTRKILALEMEYNYIFAADFDNNKLIDDLGGTFDGTIRIHALMFNAKARYPEGPIHPYIGGGLGYSFFEIGDITAREWGGPGIEHIDGSSGGGFSYQFLAGVDFDVAPNLSFGIGYKYFAALPRIGSEDDDIYSDFDYKTHVITMALTYMF